MQIYIHIPFCDLKCKYCRFASVGKVQNLHINKYVSFLCEEIFNSDYNGKKINTIYFGGGTPSVLSEKNLEKIFNTLSSKFTFSKDIEITIEATPNNITQENLRIWKNFGINRISIGVQTLNQKSLEEIGRGKKGDVEKAFENIKIWQTHRSATTIKNVGMNLCVHPKREQEQNNLNINLDFIIGLPYVKKGEILKNIKYVLNKYNFIKHISVYMLEEYYNPDKIIETKFDNITYPKSWDNLGLKDNEYFEEYSGIKDFLEKKGFKNYEISNYVKSGFECKHNKGYWSHKEVLAYGMGAGGLIITSPLTPIQLGEGNKKEYIRYLNADNFKDYYNGKKIFEENLSNEDVFLEKVMFGLRTSGLKKEFYKKLNQEKITYFIENGYLKKESEKLILTDFGVLVLDFILKEII